jgi:hypothetical protein
LVRARPLGGQELAAKQGKKGSDKGIDGVITFLDDASGKAKRALVQVKSGKVKSQAIFATWSVLCSVSRPSWACVPHARRAQPRYAYRGGQRRRLPLAGLGPRLP